MRIEWIEKYIKKAEQLIMDNHVEQGIHILSELLYDEPGYAALHNHLGWAYLYYAENLAQAEIHLRAAIALHPELAAPYLHIGQLFLRRGQYAEAAERLEAGLLRKDANRVALLESIGRAYEMRHEYRKAIGAYKQAALSSMIDFEINNLTAGIKRCRKKRWMKAISL